MTEEKECPGNRSDELSLVDKFAAFFGYQPMKKTTDESRVRENMFVFLMLSVFWVLFGPVNLVDGITAHDTRAVVDAAIMTFSLGWILAHIGLKILPDLDTLRELVRKMTAS